MKVTTDKGMVKEEWLKIITDSVNVAEKDLFLEEDQSSMNLKEVNITMNTELKVITNKGKSISTTFKNPTAPFVMDRMDHVDCLFRDKANFKDKLPTRKSIDRHKGFQRYFKMEA